jgi:hypothetical protein
VYYGPNPEGLGDAVLSIPLDPATETFFRGRERLDYKPRPPDKDGFLKIFPVQQPAVERDFSERLSWDPVASAFYFLAGWDEWVDPARDVHGRFPYSRSLLSRFDLAHVPMVDLYRRLIRSRLEALGTPIRRRLWNGRESAVCITHDIDYHRKWRPGVIVGETVRHGIKGRPDGHVVEMRRLIGALIRTATSGDPFRRSADKMLSVETVSGFGSTWFLKGGAHGRFDVSYPLERGWIRSVIDRLENAGFEVGLHTSYFASDHPEYLGDEQDRLQNQLSGALHSVRSHYLRWFAGRTPRQYADAGFLIDSSLGHAEHEGFRNATTVPFRIFDIALNRPLDLWEMPVSVMDSTLYGYRDLTVEEGIDVTNRLLATTEEFGGVLVLLWHNIMLDPLGDHRIAAHFTSITDRIDPSVVYAASLRDALSSWLDQTVATTQSDDH